METLKFFRLLYWVFLGLGIHAAYSEHMAVALFFAITCAGESLGMSIDYWPRLQKLHKTKLAMEAKNERET